ncbi:MAG: MlaD family protein [Deltaproteobacteria bacterium]|nr:MlaD family protein [Deltaproteobacteria bacterium]
MSTPLNHWKLGLFVVLGVVAGLFALVWLGAETMRREHVTYMTYFDESVQGVAVGAPIQFRGVRVGHVSDIDIAPDHRHVAVESALSLEDLRDLGLDQGKDAATRMTVAADLRIQIVSQGLTGQKALQLDYFDVATNPRPVLPFPVPPNYIPAATSTLKNVQEAVVHAADRFPAVADAMLRMTAHADRVLDGLEQAQLPQHVVATLDHADRVLVALEHAVDGAQVGALSKQAQATLATTNAVLARVDGAHGLVASAQRTSDAAGDVAGRAAALEDELVATMHDVRAAAASFARLTEALERDPDMLLKGRGGGQ